MHARTIQVRKRGTITLPVTIREKYHLEEGDPITLVDLGEGVFLSPKRSLLPKLAQEIDRLREEHGVSTVNDCVKPDWWPGSPRNRWLPTWPISASA